MGDWHWKQCRKYLMVTPKPVTLPYAPLEQKAILELKGTQKEFSLTQLKSSLDNQRATSGANSIYYPSVPVITIFIQNSLNH